MQAVQKGFMAYRGIKSRTTPADLAAYELYSSNGHVTTKTLPTRMSSLFAATRVSQSVLPAVTEDDPDPRRGTSDFASECCS